MIEDVDEIGHRNCLEGEEMKRIHFFEVGEKRNQAWEQQVVIEVQIKNWNLQVVQKEQEWKIIHLMCLQIVLEEQKRNQKKRVWQTNSAELVEGVEKIIGSENVGVGEMIVEEEG